MAVNPARYGGYNPNEPVLHEFPTLRYGGQEIPVRLCVRRTENGHWRGKLLFGAGSPDEAQATAEIFFGVNETDLWQSVYDLRDHHVKDLYRSITE